MGTLAGRGEDVMQAASGDLLGFLREVAMVRIKKAYAPSEPGDGFRVVVDRLWPRGVARARAAVDPWAREIAPSTALRRWFARDPARFEEFAARYRRELHDNAVVLRDVLQAMARPSSATHHREPGARRRTRAG